MPKVSESYLKTRRHQILEAAMACFARKGFHSTTMEDIGQEAGLSPGVAYRYFTSKEDIILATIQQSVERSRRFYETEAEEEDTPSVLEQIIDNDLQRLEEPGRDIYYKVRVQLWAEAIQNEKVADNARLLRREGLEQFSTIIQKGQERGQINSNLDAKSISLAIAAIHDGFILHWLADPDVDIWQYRTVLMAMVRGLFNHMG